MFFRVLKIYLLALPLLLTLSNTGIAEDFTSTINTVKVKSAGDNSVVVDVYINSKDANIKPKLSSRKYGDKKYVIDLMDVSQKGNVAKDTASSEGMIKDSDVRVAKLSNEASRVLINLDNPDIKVKEVNYHIVSNEKQSSDTSANKNNAATGTNVVKQDKIALPTPAKPVVAPVTASKQITKTEPVVAKPKMPPVSTVKSAVKQTKPQQSQFKKIELPKVASKVNNTSKNTSVVSNPIPGPVVVHKTDNPISPVKPAVVPDKSGVTTSNNVSKILELPDKVQHIKPQEKVKPETKPLPVIKVEHKNAYQPVNSINTKTKSLPKPEIIRSTNVKPLPNNPPVVKPELKPSHNVITKQSQPEKLQENKITEANNNLVAQANPQPAPAQKPSTSSVTDPGKTPLNLPLDTDKPGVRTVEVKGGGGDIWGVIQTMGLALIIILPLIFVTVLVIKHVFGVGDSSGLKALSSFGGNRFKIISSTSLGQGRSIHLVEIKGRQLVIGCTNNSINVLTEFGDFDQFVEENKQGDNISESPKSAARHKRNRPPLGSFMDLYKDYQKKIDEEDLEDEY